MLNDNKPLVLVVEDNKEIATLIGDQIKAFGCEVLIASNGKEALDLMSHHKVTVIMSDIYMPEMSGIQLLDIIEKKNRQIPVIIMTGGADFKDDDIAKRGGVVLLRKPFTHSQLKELTENYIKLLPTA